MSTSESVVRPLSAGVPVGVAKNSIDDSAAGVGGMEDMAAGVGGMLATKAAGVRRAFASGMGSITGGTYISGSGFTLGRRSACPSPGTVNNERVLLFMVSASSSRDAAARANESLSEKAHLAGADANGVGNAATFGPEISMKVFLISMEKPNQSRSRLRWRPI